MVGVDQAVTAMLGDEHLRAENAHLIARGKQALKPTNKPIVPGQRIIPRRTPVVEVKIFVQAEQVPASG